MPRKTRMSADQMVDVSRLKSAPPANIIRNPVNLPPVIKIKDCDYCSGLGHREEDCPTHGVDASLARENDYWISVGGHPVAGGIGEP